MLFGPPMSSTVMPSDSSDARISSHLSLPSGVMKYTFLGPPWVCPRTLALPDDSLPCCSSLLASRDACERDTPRTSATPSWVISLGAPNSMFGAMWRYLSKCSSARSESVYLVMRRCLPFFDIIIRLFR